MRLSLVILVAAVPLLASKASAQVTLSGGGRETESATTEALSPVSPSPFGALSYLNWGDLPFTINAGQTFGYNSNVLGLAQGQIAPPGTPARGDLFSTTNFGVSSKAYVGAQQLFVDGSYGLTRYRTDTVDDTHQYSLDAGVNWQVTSRCSGRLVDAINDYQSPIEEQIGAGINAVNMYSLNESGKCLLTGYVSGILDSGLSNTTNSDPADALNNYKSEFVRGGFEYALNGLDSIRALTTLTQRQYTDRGGALALQTFGLANATTQVDYQIQYHRVLSPKLFFDGMVGLSQISVVSDTSQQASASFLTPVYSASMTFQATPKLSFGFASSRTVGAPTTVLANAELSNAQSLTMNYQFSPKVALQAGVAKSSSTASTTTGFQNSNSAQNNSVSAFCKTMYYISPFITANAGFQYSDRTEFNTDVKESVVTLSLNYRPH